MVLFPRQVTQSFEWLVPFGTDLFAHQSIPISSDLLSTQTEMYFKSLVYAFKVNSLIALNYICCQSDQFTMRLPTTPPKHFSIYGKVTIIPITFQTNSSCCCLPPHAVVYVAMFNPYLVNAQDRSNCLQRPCWNFFLFIEIEQFF